MSEPRYKLKQGLKFIDLDCSLVKIKMFGDFLNADKPREAQRQWENFDCNKCRIKNDCLNPEGYSQTTWEQEIRPNLNMVGEES